MCAPGYPWEYKLYSEPVRARRQQVGGRVMFWAAKVGDRKIGPFRVEDGVKINSESYCAFLNKHFRPWWKKRPLKLRKALIYMQDNAAPSHAWRYTTAWLMGIKDKSMVNHETRRVRL